MIKEIIYLAKKYRIAANVDSLASIIQENFLKRYGYESYSSIPKDKLEFLDQYISDVKDKIEEKITSTVNNKQYIDWIYNILAKKNQGLADIDKLIEETERFENIKTRANVLNKKLEKAGKSKINDFNIQKFKTYGDLHKFISENWVYIEDGVERDQVKNEEIFFPLIVENGAYKVYSIGYSEEEDFKRIYGKSGWDTGWCIAQGTVDFGDYLGGYDSYYLILDKENKPVSLISLADLQFKDIHDNPFLRLNDGIIATIDKLFKELKIKYNELEKENKSENEDLYGDFTGYILSKNFNDRKNFDNLFEDFNKYKLLYSKDKFEVYKEEENYYFVNKSNLTIIIDYYNVSYHNKVTQEVLDYVFCFLKDHKEELTNFSNKLAIIFPNFSFNKLFDYLFEHKLMVDIFSILHYNKKLDDNRKKKILDYYLDNKVKYANAIKYITKNYFSDNFIEDYMKKNLVVEYKLKEIGEMLRRDHSCENIKKYFDILMTNYCDANTREVFSLMVNYIKYLDSEYQKKIVDFLFENDFYECFLLLKYANSESFIDMLIDKAIETENFFKTNDFVNLFEKMKMEHQEYVLKRVVEDGKVMDLLALLVKKSRREETKLKLLEYIPKDKYLDVLKMIKWNDIEDDFFINEFSKKAFEEGHGEVIFDYIKRANVNFNKLIDYLSFDDFKGKETFFKDVIIGLNDREYHVSTEKLERMVFYFQKNKKLKILEELAECLDRYQDFKISIIAFLIKEYNKNEVKKLLRKFDGDRSFLEQLLYKTNEEDKKIIIQDYIDNILD